MVRLDGVGDGPKWTCDPWRLRQWPDCLIYSIGSNGEYGWENGMLREAPNCEIHVFDPTDYADKAPKNANVHFHQWGLGSSYDSEYQVKNSAKQLLENVPLKTFQETLAILGHENRRIDIFKIDCEGCEWASYKDWVKHDIHQVLVEAHGIPDPKKANEWHHKPMGPSGMFVALRDEGFALYSKEYNPLGQYICCVELSYIKLRPSFWKD